MAKWVTVADDAAALPELVSHAFHTATSGRPGPVVIALPEDVQADEADVADAAPYQAAQASPAEADVARALELLAAAERPLIVVGGGGWSEQAGRDVLAFAEASNIPVVASFRRQDYVDNASPVYAGPADDRAGPEARAARPRRRRPARARHAARGDRDAAVLARRAAAPGPDADPRPRRPGRARARLRGGAADRLRLAAVRRSAAARRRRRPRRLRRGGAARLPRQPPAPEAPGRARAGGGDGAPARAAARRCRDHERRGQLHGVGAPLLRVPPLRHAARAVRGRDGLRDPGRDRREAPAPGARGRLPLRRRRLPDERARARHRDAVRRRDRRARRQQRHARDDPHAPGAPVRPRRRAPTSSTRTSSPTARPSARTRRWSSGTRTSRPRSRRRSPPAARRCSSCASTPRRSPREPRSASCAAGSVSVMRELLRETADYAADFLESLPERPVMPQVDLGELRARMGGPVPDGPSDPREVVAELASVGSEAAVAIPGGRYFGFVIGGAVPAALAADWLTSTWDQNAGLYVAGAAAAVVEETAGAWLADLLRLPRVKSFAFVTGTQMAHATALAAARNHVLARGRLGRRGEGPDRGAADPRVRGREGALHVPAGAAVRRPRHRLDDEGRRRRPGPDARRTRSARRSRATTGRRSSARRPAR